MSEAGHEGAGQPGTKSRNETRAPHPSLPPARPLQVFRCARCAATWFPRRSLCARCGGDGFEAIDGSRGTLEQSTVLRHWVGADSTPEGGESARHLATVRSAAGPVLIVGLDGPLAAGCTVEVWEHEGRLWARPLGTNEDAST